MASCSAIAKALEDTATNVESSLHFLPELFPLPVFFYRTSDAAVRMNLL